MGLLHAIDERLSVWGWETPTGTKFVIVLDAWGLPEQPEGGDGDTRYLPGMGGGGGLAWGMKEGDLKPVSLLLSQVVCQSSAIECGCFGRRPKREISLCLACGPRQSPAHNTDQMFIRLSRLSKQRTSDCSKTRFTCQTITFPS